jgi:2,3-dihydro-2,3-dihydroxybenzoate dehydrogenase
VRGRRGDGHLEEVRRDVELSGLSGTVAVVTGAGRGIGQAVASALAEAGARLAIADIDAGSVEETRASLARDTEVFARALDVTRRDAVEQFVADAHARLGAIDSLVNVAGIQRLGPLTELPEADFDATFAVNVKGVFLMTQAAAKRMAGRKKGAVVTISSNAALVPRVKQGAYCASKAAVSHLMRVFALELGPLGIRCNCVDPGATETDMIRNMVATMGLGELLLRGSLESFRVGTPLQKNAQVADVANAVLFLLSDQAGHITMHDLVVDGGSSLGA